MASFLTRRTMGAFLIAVLALGLSLRAYAGGADLLVIEFDGQETRFDEAGFAALPQSELVSHTAWTEGPHRFAGVLLRDLLAAAGLGEAGLEGKALELVALNEYVVTIGAEDAFDYDSLVARTMDGAPMLRSDKGPLWLVYPRDDHRKLQDQRFDHRWAWQLKKITIR